MGTKISKQEQDGPSFQNEKSYENISRAYVKWNQCSSPVSHDESRFTSNEIRNFKRTKQFQENYSDQQKLNYSNISKKSSSNQKFESNHLLKEKFIYDKNVQQNKNTIKRSQSVDQLLKSNNRITVEQLINHNLKQKKTRSSFSQSSDQIVRNQNNLKPLSTTNIIQLKSSNGKKRQIPADLQLVLINQYDLQVKLRF